MQRTYLPKGHDGFVVQPLLLVLSLLRLSIVFLDPDFKSAFLLVRNFLFFKVDYCQVRRLGRALCDLVGA